MSKSQSGSVRGGRWALASVMLLLALGVGFGFASVELAKRAGLAPFALHARGKLAASTQARRASNAGALRHVVHRVLPAAATPGLVQHCATRTANRPLFASRSRAARLSSAHLQNDSVVGGQIAGVSASPALEPPSAIAMTVPSTAGDYSLAMPLVSLGAYSFGGGGFGSRDLLSSMAALESFGSAISFSSSNPGNDSSGAANNVNVLTATAAPQADSNAAALPLAVEVATVPEPTSLALLAIGLLTVAALRRRNVQRGVVIL